MISTQHIKNEIQSLSESISNHKLYSQLVTKEDIQTFMSHHVYAVWDFMSLVKRLQSELTCISVPWRPVGNPEVRFLINEIVVGEECDVDRNGVRLSHFEMYMNALENSVYNTTPIKENLNLLNKSKNIFETINKLDLQKSIKEFLNFTFDIVINKEIHIVAGVFTFGREDLIPNMFTAMVEKNNIEGQYDDLLYYLERHIEVDGGHHSNLALQMVEELCGDNQKKWEEVLYYSKQSLVKRMELWNGILEDIETHKLAFSL